MTDWQIGDRALCIQVEHPTLGKTRRVELGKVYTVRGVYVSRSSGHVGLILIEAKPRTNPGFHAFMFQRLHPDEHHGERCDWELLLKRTKRTVRA